MESETPTIPHSYEAEHAMCAAILMDPAAIAHATELSPTCFYSQQYRDIFLAACKTYAIRGAVDPLLLTDQLREDNNLDRVGGVSTIARLIMPDGFTFGHAKHYAAILKREEGRRQAVMAASDLSAIARSGDALFVLQAFKDAVRRIEDSVQPTTLREVDLAAALRNGLPPIPWIAEGWLGEGDNTILAGEWATGKSIVSFDLAMSVAGDRRWMRRVPILKHGPVLVVDEENNLRNVQRRSCRMFQADGLTADDVASLPIRYLNKNCLKLDRPHGRVELFRIIERYKPILVVLDSLIRFHSKDENKSSEMAAFFGESIAPISARFGCAVVMLDHMSKPTKDDHANAAHRTRGSGEKLGFGDNAWTLEGDRETDNRILSCRKNRWEDALPPPMTTKWCLSESEDEAWLEASDASLSAEVVVTTLLQERPEGINATGLWDLATARGIPLRTVKRTINRLVATNSLSKDRSGKQVFYRLPSGTKGR